MTLEEVAKLAKVSTATVSRVLSGSPGVSEATRQRVLQAAADLNYHLNLNASALAGRPSSTLGMIVSNLENPFFADVYRAAAARASTHNWVLADTRNRADEIGKHIRHLMGWRVGGLALVFTSVDAALLREASALRIPVCIYDAGEVAENFLNVTVDYKSAVEQVLNYLQGKGHKRVGLIACHSPSNSLAARDQAFQQGLELAARGMEWQRVECADSLEGGRSAAAELIRSGFHPTAIVGVNDYISVGVLAELRALGVKVPEDISVIGFDNLGLSEIMNPTLSTVQVSRERIGESIADALVSGQDFRGGQVLIVPQLLIRETSGPARREQIQKPASA